MFRNTRLFVCTSLVAIGSLLGGCADTGSTVECGPSTVLSGDTCVAECAEGEVLLDGECTAATECGPGTILSEGECVPECGDGEVYLDGECVPDTECGDGTVLVDGECVPECADDEVFVDGDCVPETECGPGTVLVDGECIPNDGVGPAAVTDLVIDSDGNDLLVSWTNPTDTDFAGVLLLRQSRVPVFMDGTPSQFVEYSVGDEVEGVEIIHISAASANSFADPTALLGMRYSYAAFAFDEARNYSVLAIVIGVEPLPVQTTQIQIADPAGTATPTVTTAPGNMGLTVTNVSVNAGLLSLTLNVTNNFDIAVVAPKVVLDGTNQGVPANAMGTMGGNSYWRFNGAYGSPGSGEAAMQQSFLAIAQGSEVSQTIAIDGIDGSVDPVVIDLTLGRDPIVGFSLHEYNDPDAIFAQFYDQGTHSFHPTLPKSSGSSNSGSDQKSACGSAVISSNNRWFFCGSSHSASVKIYDLAQMGQVIELDVIEVPIHRDVTVDTTAELSLLVDTTALIRGLALSPDDQMLYATVGYGGVGGDLDAIRADGLDVVRIDISDPTAPVVDQANRVILDDTDDQATSIGCELSPNGKVLAVVGYNTETLHFVDTVLMAEIDTDADIPGTQPIALGDFGDAGAMVWRGNGLLLVANDYWDSHKLMSVDVFNGYQEQVVVDSPDRGEPIAMDFDSEGRLWILHHLKNGAASVLWVHEYSAAPLLPTWVGTPVSFLNGIVEIGGALGLWLSSDHSRLISSTDGNNAVAREFSTDTPEVDLGYGTSAAPYTEGRRQDDYGHWTTGTSL